MGGHTPLDDLIPDVSIPEDFLSKFWIGRCPYDVKYACSSPGSSYTDVNIWDRALSQDEVSSWTTCNNFEKGNVINWDTVELQLWNMTDSEMPIESICYPISPGDVLIPSPRNFDSLIDLCQKFHGEVSVVTSSEQHSKLTSTYKDSAASCTNPYDGYWVGWWDRPSEGRFVDVNSMSSLAPDGYQPWFLGEPNGREQENCAISWTETVSNWNDARCDLEYCGFCRLEFAPVFILRGTP